MLIGRQFVRAGAGQSAHFGLRDEKLVVSVDYCVEKSDVRA